MRFEETRLPGAFVIDLEEISDERGFFARAWCQKEFESHGLVSRLAQVNFSKNRRQGTLRGMHYQVRPYAEVKLIRCIRGALYDAIVDLRPDSTTYLQWFGVELSSENRRMLYVPEGFAHGFLTLEDDTEALYQVSEFYAPQAERGARFNDPAFDIDWPIPVRVISDKDASWNDFQPKYHGAAAS
jgi:dTDP-4-dehydrorhamnose 3,5-epimerase